MECEVLLKILKEFGYSIDSENEHYITLKSEYHPSDYINLIITLPNREIIARPIIEAILKQGNISRHSFIEKMKEIEPIFGRESIVAHVDILGFKSLLEEAQDDPVRFDEILNQYNRALKAPFNRLQSTPELDHIIDPTKISHVRVYTDNLLFVNELDNNKEGEPDFGITLREIAHYQLNLALEGYFTRGVIFVERSYADEILVFSPALLYAEDYEKKAVNPRVILEEPAVTRVKHYLQRNEGSKQNQFDEILLVDKDGQWFVNYLYVLYRFSEDRMHIQMHQEGNSPVPHSSYYPEAITQLHQHRDHILKNLAQFKDKPEIYRKYQWLAEYHNFFCNKYFPSDHSVQIAGMKESFSSPCQSFREWNDINSTIEDNHQ